MNSLIIVYFLFVSSIRTNGKHEEKEGIYDSLERLGIVFDYDIQNKYWFSIGSIAIESALITRQESTSQFWDFIIFIL